MRKEGEKTGRGEETGRGDSVEGEARSRRAEERGGNNKRRISDVGVLSSCEVEQLSAMVVFFKYLVTCQIKEESR